MLTHLYFTACDYKCEVDNTCISKLYVCTGDPTCSDGQDENNCGNQDGCI